MPEQPEGYEEAARAFAANVSPRYLRLEGLERWVNGRQYDELPDWWTGGETECPRWERRPCVVYPVAHIAASSNTDLVLGEGRFPTLTTKPAGEGDDAKDGQISETDAEALDELIAEYHKLCRFRSHSREAFNAAQACGTAIGLHGHRNGKPFAELIPAKWGTPTLQVDGSVSEIEIRYPFLEERKIDGAWRVRAMLYRRVITPERDVTYLPAEAREDGTEPDWQPDPKQDIPHNLGFCPVVWYPFMKGCQPINVIDGNAIHDNFRDEIHQLDLALSTAQTCMLNSEPQPVEIGVDANYNPTGEQGRTAIVPSTERGGMPGMGDTGAITGGYIVGQSKSARKRGGGFIWSYPNEKTKVEYLAFPTGLLEEQQTHCDALLSKIEQSMAVVLPKPSQFKMAGSVSGVAIQETKAQQLDRCDQYRDDFEQGFLVPSVNMQLRIAQRVGTALKVPGIEAAKPILDGFNSDAVAAA